MERTPELDPLLTWSLIGAIVGITLGLTGAGGAVIGVPLFILWGGMGLKEATVVSLVAVFLGAMMNGVSQRRFAVPRIAILTAGASWIGATGAAQYKASAPEWILKVLFMSLVLTGLFFVWKKKNPKEKSVSSSASSGPAFQAMVLAGGVVLGVITTLTGLGGGVVLLPWYLGPLGLAPATAVATSLVTVALAAIVSMISQASSLAVLWNPDQLAPLAAGTLLSSVIVRTLLNRLSPARTDLLRKVVYSVVAGVSLWAMT